MTIYWFWGTWIAKPQRNTQMIFVNCISFLTYTVFLQANQIFHLSLRLLRKDVNIRLKDAKKLLREKVTKHFFISDDGYRAFSRSCMDNTIDSIVRSCICFLEIKSFYCVSYRTHSASAFFIANPLNEKNHQLLAIFENWGSEVAKQLLNFLAVSEPEPLAI